MLKAQKPFTASASRSEELRLSVFFATIFLVVGCYMPFMPVWLESRGLGAEDIALALALPLLVRPALGPLIGMWADATGSYRIVAVALALGSLTALLFLSQAPSLLLIMLALTFYTELWTAQLPLADTIAVRAATKGAHYGRMRLWGSLSFVAATLSGGAALDMAGAGAAIVILGGAGVCVLAAAMALPGGGESAPIHPLDEEAIERPKSRFSRGFRKAASQSGFWLFLFAASLTYASHAVYYTFGSVHWLSLGASGTWVSILWTVGVLAEVLLFSVSAWVMRFLSPAALIALAGGAAALRWLVMAFDPPWAAVVALQLLHGLTFGAAHLGAMFFISRAFPAKVAATAQAAYASATAGFALAVATAASGPLYRDLGSLAYLPMAALGAGSLLLSLWLLSIGPKSGNRLSEESDVQTKR